MKPSSSRLHRRIVRKTCIVTALAFTLQGARAQVAPQPSSTTRPAESDTVTLNPFEVKADSDKSYGALNSNTITSFNAALADLPVTANILSRKFLDDVGVINVEDAIMMYDAGSQFGGSGLAQPAVNQPGDHGSNPGLSLRGAKIGGTQTDGIQLNSGNYGATSFGSTSSYNLERVEVINGPQALLYSGVGPGGVVNMVEKEARFNRAPFGSIAYRIDQYGSKYATFDYGVSRGNLAARVSLVKASNKSRRVFVGDQLRAAYIQLAAKFGNTTVRLSLQQSIDARIAQNYQNLSSTGDPDFAKFDNMRLEYLLATNQASGILNGKLNWDNSASYTGQQVGDHFVGEHGIIKVDSTWTNWFATRLIVGAANYNDMEVGSGTINMYSPRATANPLPGNWTMGMPQSGFPMQANWRPHVTKSIRFTALFTNQLFGGRAKSQTTLNVDSVSTDASLPIYNYYKADANWNVIFDPAVPSNNGRTLLPSLNWTVNDGPQLYTFFNPNVDRINYNGTNYVLSIRNLTQGRTFYYQKGFALLNYTQWMNGKLDTLIGARANTTNGEDKDHSFKKPLFSVGAIYHLLPWLSPYVAASDLWNFNNTQQPNGEFGANAHSINEELGLKFHPEDSRISGSLSFYHRFDTNTNYPVQNIGANVSPNGLNGQIPSGTGGNIVANIRSYGVTAAIAAAPTKDWRMRLSAAWTGGRFESGVSYSQLYNDQFYTDRAGNVTYANGTQVYVPASFNRNQLTVPAGTAGSVPLTVALLSTPGSQYFTQPQPVNGAILKTSNGGLVLLNGGSPTAGPIVTGATGLPISEYQLNPSLSGVAPVGVVNAAIPGRQTHGYPAYSMNFTNVYEFSSGLLRGFKLGGTVSADWKYLVSYYYPSATRRGPTDITQFYRPIQAQFNLITGYSHRFKRVTWSAQLNVNNLFNHYKVMIFPNANTGYSVPTSLVANFDRQPRRYVFTNTLSF